MKTVSVIVPTYNREKRIERTLASVLNQDYESIEIIVVDDGSTDATESIVKRVADSNIDVDKRIRYVWQINQGACVARNRGMMLATGDYIMFLDSDDLIKPTKLSVQVNQIESENTQCSICDFECIDDAGVVGETFENSKRPHDFIRTFVSPHISTVIMRRDSIPPGLQWNARLRSIQDLDFILKYFASVQTWAYVNEALFCYCLHGEERISDCYTKSMPYGTLRKSFKSYLDENKGFIATDARKLNSDYARAVWAHQIKNTLIRSMPNFVKKIAK